MSDSTNLSLDTLPSDPPPDGVQQGMPEGDITEEFSGEALRSTVPQPDGEVVTGLVSNGPLAEMPETGTAGNDILAEGLDLEFAQQVLEAALLSAAEPLGAHVLRRLFQPDIGADLMNRLLTDLQRRWEGRSVQLVRLASGWRFQTGGLFQPYLDRLRETRAPRYSRAVLETLAIIVYRQPVTRGDIEEIRGVSVSSQIVKLLEMRGWIDSIGYRDTPGRPALYATTKKFLDDLGLRSLTELPPLTEFEGVLDLVDTAEAASSTPAAQFESPGNSGGEQAEEQSPDRASPDQGSSESTGH